MALAGNLTSLSIADADLEKYHLTIGHYQPTGQADFADQRSAGSQDALSAWAEANSEDPAYAVPVYAGSWTRILVYFTLAVIFEGTHGEQWRDDAIHWRQKGMDAIGSFRYQIDRDEDESLSGDEEEERGIEIRMLR